MSEFSFPRCSFMCVYFPFVPALFFSFFLQLSNSSFFVLLISSVYLYFPFFSFSYLVLCLLSFFSYFSSSFVFSFPFFSPFHFFSVFCFSHALFSPFLRFSYSLNLLQFAITVAPLIGYLCPCSNPNSYSYIYTSQWCAEVMSRKQRA